MKIGAGMTFLEVAISLVSDPEKEKGVRKDENSVVSLSPGHLAIEVADTDHSEVTEMERETGLASHNPIPFLIASQTPIDVNNPDTPI
jgi:hypothetical protein